MTVRATFLTLAILLVAACLAASAAARADLYALGHDEAANAMVVRSTSSGNASMARVSDCCAIASGTATFDTSGNRAFFIGQTATAAEVVGYNYVSGASTRVPLSSGYAVTHMEYDAAGARLLALARDRATDQLVMAAINPATGVLTVRAVLPAPCCVLRTGVSALTSTGGLRFFVIGRNANAAEELLVFNFDASSGPQVAAIPAGLSINELVVHPLSGALFGLAHNAAANASQPVQVGAAPGFAISTPGSATANCCYVLAGAAAIDRVNNRLAVIGSATALSTPSLQLFDLASGAHSTGIALRANGLFEDSGVNTESLFANGFE